MDLIFKTLERVYERLKATNLPSCVIGKREFECIKTRVSYCRCRFCARHFFMNLKSKHPRTDFKGSF